MFRRILVPLDGSTFSEHAIPYATKIAAAFAARLEFALVHVAYRPVVAGMVPHPVPEWERAQHERDADYLQRVAQRVAAASGRPIDPVLLSGDVAPVLEQEIKERGVDLLVMTTHGRAGLERAWLGSVADTLVRHIDAPVLLIRPTDGGPIDVDRPAPPFRHVLIALDGSERAERSLAPATALARADSARTTLLRALAPPLGITSPYIPHAIELTHNELQQREAEVREYMQRKVHELKLRGLDAAAEIVLDYHAVHAILRFANTQDVGLIALGTHGHGPIARLVLGSVSDKVVRAADVPVLVC